MALLTQSNAFPTSAPRAETPMDKTTRAVRKILEGETERRQIKTKRLRMARLEKEAVAPVKAIAPTTKGARKKSRLKE